MSDGEIEVDSWKAEDGLCSDGGHPASPRHNRLTPSRIWLRIPAVLSTTYGQPWKRNSKRGNGFNTRTTTRRVVRKPYGGYSVR